jgi:16S rRNA (uracil1498-N3)-methyltransferase
MVLSIPMMDDDFFKLPRLYIDATLGLDQTTPLSAEQAHYFKTVLRRQDGDPVRLFNGRDGEWLATLDQLGKKGGFAVATRQIKTQPAAAPRVHLFFAPIKKTRMDWLVEKSIELGATDLHPVLTQNTEIRDINTKRLHQQIMEAAEQCERLDLPRLHDAIKFHDLGTALPANTCGLACLERGDTLPLATRLNAIPSDQDIAVLIGPEGGFTKEEATSLSKQAQWLPTSLGPRILRCETAVCAALSAIMLK